MTKEELEKELKAEKEYSATLRKEIDEYTISHTLCAKYKKLEEENAELEKENAELEAQIEKMKCCGNCNHFDFSEPNYCHKGVYRERQYVCSKWEFVN